MKLDRMLDPKSIALVGATSRPGSVGRSLLDNLTAEGSKRKIFAVNPYKKAVLGKKCYSKVTDIKGTIDLVVVAVPAEIVPKIVKDCCQKKVGGIIVISSGFAESGERGRALQEEISKTARTANIPLLGPNCLGIIRPPVNLNASFGPVCPQKGRIAFLSQSGALIDSVIDDSLMKNYGFSLIVSYGNEADLEAEDFLRWLKNDRETKVIAIYLEGLKNGRRFMKISKEVSRKKPILVLKAGKTMSGREAALSHTASLAGDPEIYSAAFKQSGIIEVDTLEELIDLSKAMSWQPRCKNGIGIVTNGGGAGVLAADYCYEEGIRLPGLQPKTIKRLEMSQKMHPSFPRRNPLDIIGDALSDRYRVAIEALLKQKNIFGILVIQTLQMMTETEENAKIIVDLKRKWKAKPIICCFLGGKLTMPGIKILEKNQIPNYPELKRAVKAMKALIK